LRQWSVGLTGGLADQLKLPGTTHPTIINQNQPTCFNDSAHTTGKYLNAVMGN